LSKREKITHNENTTRAVERDTAKTNDRRGARSLRCIEQYRNELAEMRTRLEKYRNPNIIIFCTNVNRYFKIQKKYE